MKSGWAIFTSKKSCRLSRPVRSSEQYLDDTPYASCLILGYTRSGRPLHLVCAPVSSEERLVVITTYQPDPNRWDQDLRRRKR